MYLVIIIIIIIIRTRPGLLPTDSSLLYMRSFIVYSRYSLLFKFPTFHNVLLYVSFDEGFGIGRKGKHKSWNGSGA